MVLALALPACKASEARETRPSAAAAAPGAAADQTRPATTGPVVVELFTSQGCSSCPPADRVLSEIGKQEGVIALAFHVDYWNDIGWADPFSSAAWSARQRAYAGVLDGRVYTPQLVIQGRAHVVGSNRRAVRRAIEARAAHAPPRSVALSASARCTGTNAAPGLRVEVETDAGDALILVALHESGSQTAVTAGENRGRDLQNDYIVRRLASARARRGMPGATVDIDIDSTWTGTLGAVVFVQDPDTLAIHAATEIEVAGVREGCGLDPGI